jgi:hypothetical protein
MRGLMKKCFFFSLFSSIEGFTTHPSPGKPLSKLINGNNMYNLRFVLMVIFISFVSANIFAQDINVHKAIGKKTSEVVKLFGSPAHQDNSNASMKCMFYKGNNYTLTFVADEKGVYQAEASATYDDELKARSVITKLLEGCCNEYKIDSVSVSDFDIAKPGVKADVQLAENKITKKYDVRVKASRSEN